MLQEAYLEMYAQHKRIELIKPNLRQHLDNVIVFLECFIEQTHVPEIIYRLVELKRILSKEDFDVNCLEIGRMTIEILNDRVIENGQYLAYIKTYFDELKEICPHHNKFKYKQKIKEMSKEPKKKK